MSRTTMFVRSFAVLSLLPCLAACSSDPTTGGTGGSSGSAATGAASGSSGSAATGAASGSSGSSGSAATGAASGSSGSSTAAVSFANDVMPFFAASCARDASCHGAASVATNGLASGGNRAYFLGTADSVWKHIVGVSSFEDPSMNVVTAGDPTKSFLMYKMDGNLSGLASACSTGDTGNCGGLMPLGSTALAKSVRDVVRTWISQGAKNN